MTAKILNIAARLALAVMTLTIGRYIAQETGSVVVTTDGLILTVTLLIVCRLIWPGLRQFITSRKAQQADISMTKDARPFTSALTAEEEKQAKAPLPSRAKHEAAHAIAVCALGHRLIYISLQQRGFSGGRTVWRHRDERLTSIDHIAVSYIGQLAEKEENPQTPPDSGSDDTSRILRDSITVSMNDPQDRTPEQIMTAGIQRARQISRDYSDAIDDLTETIIESGNSGYMNEKSLRSVINKHGLSTGYEEEQSPQD